MTEMIEQARAILRRNDRGGYTVPTDRLYPFQWNWDSAFVAMGWATFDEARALTEVERLLEGQWDDGLVPQIGEGEVPMIVAPLIPHAGGREP